MTRGKSRETKSPVNSKVLGCESSCISYNVACGDHKCEWDEHSLGENMCNAVDGGWLEHMDGWILIVGTRGEGRGGGGSEHLAS